MAQSASFNAAAEAVAGALGGFISSAVLFPLDFVKTQQQVCILYYLYEYVY